jgi:AbrB family looped-hinge helix DNA binding protein
MPNVMRNIIIRAKKCIVRMAFGAYNRSKECKESKNRRNNIMEISRISSKGQVTIPIDIRKRLNLKEGDKVIFVEEDDRVFIANASLVALKRMEKVMEGKAEKAGIKNEDDVVALVKEVRRELWEKNYENND